MVKRVVFVGEVRDEDVELAVVIVVARSHAHTTLLATILVHGSAGAKPNLLERAVALVSVMEIRRRVVGDKDVDQAVVIEIAGENTETVISVRIRDARLFGNVRKSAVAVVAKERIARTL